MAVPLGPIRRTLAALYFVTGTDTGVGKTVLTALLARELQARGISCLAVKPIGSGGRCDARILREVQGNRVPLDAINPWHYRSALTPREAARRAGCPLRWDEVLPFLRSLRRRDGVVLVEGAGGLLSPLGEDFDNRSMLRELKGVPLIVAVNRLGCLNHVRLTIEALGSVQFLARVALVAAPGPDGVRRSNLDCIEEWLGRDRVVAFPWLPLGASAPLTTQLSGLLGRLLGFA